MASGWNLWVWLECIGVVIIIINFPYSTCISSFFGSSIPTSLFIIKKNVFSFFVLCSSLRLRTTSGGGGQLNTIKL